MKECPLCRGEGKLVEDYIQQDIIITSPCWVCNGKGQITLWQYLFSWLRWQKKEVTNE